MKTKNEIINIACDRISKLTDRDFHGYRSEIWNAIATAMEDGFMTESIEQAAYEFLKVVKHNATSNVIRFYLDFSHGDLHMTFDYRNPKELKESGVTMRNIRGEWIEESKS
jgi:hypothetical protein